MSEGIRPGHEHPVSALIREIETIFSELGFSFVQGPEVDSEYYNFDALNVPADHPARDMQDTFWIASDRAGKSRDRKNDRELPRTHTSSVQGRYLEEHKPPIRIIVPGKVFRNEAIDATHEVQFHQVEGLVVDEATNMSHLRGTLNHFFKKLFADKISIRLRPGFFPFVEPGVEIDMSCFKCGGTGCSLCKRTGWIEVCGAGMVHPNVLLNAGIDPRRYQGFAFGVGIERLAMLRYGIDDIRLFYSGDLRFLSQF
jgi:phenylalanyl-tRNA synthetase alpha chain